MLHAFLASALLAVQGPAHSSLHPAEADLFMEVGNVNALLTTLDSAPLPRFLRDERIRGLLAQVGQDPSRSFKQLLEQGLAAVGPDFLAGGWLDGLGTLSASMVALPPSGDASVEPAILLVAELATPEQANALRTAALGLMPGHEPATTGLPGMETFRASGEGGWCAVVGNRFVLGNGGSSPEAFGKRAGEAGGGLASNEAFKKQVAALPKASGTPIAWFSLGRSARDIAATMNGGKEDEAVSFLDKLPAGMNPLASPTIARMQFEGGRFLTDMFASDVPGAAAEKPVDPAWLEPVPSSAMFVYSGAFDGASAGKRVRELLAADESSSAAMAALEQKLGYGPEKVLARLGPGLTITSQPLSGLGLPEIRVWVDCEDPAAFTAEYEALIGALGDSLPGFTAKTKPYKLKKKDSDEKVEVPITTLTLPPGLVQLPMVSLSPTFAPVGKRLVFAMSSMEVKSELKRVHSGEGEAIVAGAKPLAALGLELPADARSVVVMDWGKLLGGLVGMVKAFAPMAGPDALPFDPAKLPPPEIFTEYFKPTFHYSRSLAGGRYRRNEASFGPETWAGFLGAGVIIGRKQSAMLTAPGAAQPEMLEPVGGGK